MDFGESISHVFRNDLHPTYPPTGTVYLLVQVPKINNAHLRYRCSATLYGDTAAS